MRQSLTLKILLLTLVIIVLGIGIVVTYFLNVQNYNLIAEREAGVEQQISVLYQSIKNNMLVGTAPIARSLLTDLKQVRRIREITLFRANGREAFSDDSTIKAVNQALGQERFKLPTPMPQEVIEILNVYMQRQVGIILKAGGDVDQLVGDQILGVFGSPTMVEDAIGAAIAIMAAIEELSRSEKKEIRVGIGIHTGPMIAGNIGAQGDVERLQRTVIGDAVNLGARLCSVAAGGEVLISQETYDRVKDRVQVDAPRTVTVKGKSQPVTVYPVLRLRR